MRSLTRSEPCDRASHGRVAAQPCDRVSAWLGMGSPNQDVCAGESHATHPGMASMPVHRRGVCRRPASLGAAYRMAPAWCVVLRRGSGGRCTPRAGQQSSAPEKSVRLASVAGHRMVPFAGESRNSRPSSVTTGTAGHGGAAPAGGRAALSPAQTAQIFVRATGWHPAPPDASLDRIDAGEISGAPLGAPSGADAVPQTCPKTTPHTCHEPGGTR